MPKRKGFRNLTKLVFVLAVIWMVVAATWFFQIKDYSEFFVHLAIGLGAIVVSMLYEMIIRLKMDFKDLDNTVSSLASWSQKEIDGLKK